MTPIKNKAAREKLVSQKTNNNSNDKDKIKNAACREKFIFFSLRQIYSGGVSGRSLITGYAKTISRVPLTINPEKIGVKLAAGKDSWINSCSSPAKIFCET